MRQRKSTPDVAKTVQHFAQPTAPVLSEGCVLRRRCDFSSRFAPIDKTAVRSRCIGGGGCVERRVCPDAAKVRGPGPPISSGLWLLSIAPLYRLATPYGRELIDGRAEAASVQ